MISVELAASLKAAGLVWHPVTGDRFTLLTGAFDGEVFTLSDMVVEAHQSQAGTVLGFNGTTEWALDATEATDALWLPREDQLRALLGASFVALERVDVVGTNSAGYRVMTVLPGDGSGADQHSAYWADEPAEAYGRALLALVRRATD
jgi:hypothetical protein